MPQQASKVVPMVNRVRWAETSAADTQWSDIQRQINNIDRVIEALAERYTLGGATAEACDVIRRMCGNMRKLQEVQRRGYNPQADDGIATIATRLIPAAVKRVDWPGVPVTWLDSVRLSCATIGRMARERQEANRDI